MANVVRQVKCPYCGMMNAVTVSPDEWVHRARPDVWVCDVEGGGCDEAFVIKVAVAVSVAAAPIGVYKREVVR